MAKILIGIVAALACLVLAESLDCNKCTVGLFGLCLGSSSVTCSTNTSVCYTSKASFPSVSGFKGFSQQGCTESTTCGSTNSSTTNGSLPIIGLSYSIMTECCSTSKCNPVNLSGAASSSTASLSLLSVAALAAVMRSYM